MAGLHLHGEVPGSDLAHRRRCRWNSDRSLLLAWIAFRFETIRRMLGAEREERGQRAHLLEGLLRAVGLMDAVVKTVRESFSASEARQRLTSEQRHRCLPFYIFASECPRQ